MSDGPRRGGVSTAVRWTGRSRQRRNTAARWPLSGLAAALDEYEDAPHGARGYSGVRRRAPPVSPSVRHPRRSARGARPCADSAVSPPPELPDIVIARVRRLAQGRVRVVLPQRDRPAAGDAGRDPRRHDGRVRHRLRRRDGVAALRRTRREGPDHHRRAGRQARRRGRGDLRRRPAGRGAGRGLVDAARQGPVLAAVPRLRPAHRGRRRRGRRPGRGRRHRRARRLHAVRGLAAGHLRPGRHAARAVAHRRAVHRRRGDGRPRRLGADRDRR